MKKHAIIVGALMFTTTIAFGSLTTQVSFDSGSFLVLNLGGVTPLTAGNLSANGDGAVLQLGYYSSATVSNNFLGTWIPLTGEGSLNTGGSTDSSGGTLSMTRRSAMPSMMEALRRGSLR